MIAPYRENSARIVINTATRRVALPETRVRLMRVSSLSRFKMMTAFTTLVLWIAGCSGPDKTHAEASPSSSAADTPSQPPSGPVRLGPGEATVTLPLKDSSDSREGDIVRALDVAGIKLGMTPEQVLGALKSFDSSLVLSKRYLAAINANQLHYAAQTSPNECTDKEPFRLFTGIVGAKATTFFGGGTVAGPMGNLGIGCGDDTKTQPGDEPETVTVHLTPQPGRHRVIAVSLWKSFKSPSTFEAVLSGALRKYPAEMTAKREQGVDRYHFWRFDARERVMSADMAKRQGLLNGWIEPFGGGRDVPPIVHEGNGVGIDLVIGTDYSNPQIAKQFRVSLYDENALYQFAGQAKAVYDVANEKRQKDEADKAKKSAPAVKM